VKNYDDSRKILYLCLYLVVSILLSKIFIPFFLDTTLHNAELSFFTKTFIGQIFAFGLPLFALLYLLKTNNGSKIVRERLFKLPDGPIFNKANVFFVLLTIGVYALIKWITESFMLFLYYLDPSNNLSMVPQHPNAQSFFVIVIVVAIIPAFIEELTYRGIYYDAFKSNKYMFISVSSIVFILAHSNPISNFTALVLSLYLCFVLINTQSIKTVILIHFLFNLISLGVSNYIVLPLSLHSAIQSYEALPSILGYALINLGLALFMLIVVIILSMSIFKKIKDKSHSIKKSTHVNKMSKREYLFSAILVLISFIAYLYFDFL